MEPWVATVLASGFSAAISSFATAFILVNKFGARIAIVETLTQGIPGIYSEMTRIGNDVAEIKGYNKASHS